MKIQHIHWLEENEAELTVTDGQFTVTVFCCPCSLSLDENIQGPLEVFEPQQVRLLRQKDSVVSLYTYPNQLHGYSSGGILENIEHGYVRVGNFMLAIGKGVLPGDAQVGDRISFTFTRLDA